MIGKVWKMLAWIAFCAVATQPAAAQGTGTLTSKIELEKLSTEAADQVPTKTYVAPETVVPGDRIRVTLAFVNNGATPAAGVNLTNPIPDGLVFDGADDAAGFAVSIDGGATFGALAELTVAVAGSAPRPAVAADVTHVRWLWPDAVAPGQARSVAFFGRVR